MIFKCVYLLAKEAITNEQILIFFLKVRKNMNEDFQIESYIQTYESSRIYQLKSKVIVCFKMRGNNKK